MPNRYVLLLLVTSLFWGGNFVVSKSLVEHASPMTLTSLRWLIAVVCLLPIVWWKEKKLLPPRQALLPLFLMGLTGVVLFNICQFLALEHTTSTNAGLISTLNTISIAIFSLIFLKEKITIWQIGAVLLSLFGVILVLTQGKLGMLLSVGFNIGDVWMIVAVCIWGIYSICSKWAMQIVSPLLCTLYAGIFGLIILLPFNVASFSVTNINTSFIQALLYTGIISTVVCMLLWNVGVQKLGATTAGVFLNFNPIFTAILALLLLGEQLTSVQVMGGLLVIGGCYLFSHFKTEKCVRL